MTAHTRCADPSFLKQLEPHMSKAPAKKGDAVADRSRQDAAGWFSLDKETRGLLATTAHQPRPAVLERAAARRGLSRAGPPPVLAKWRVVPRAPRRAAAAWGRR
jgi:hypothetical protein